MTLLNLALGRAVSCRTTKLRLPVRKLNSTELSALVTSYREGKSVDVLAHDFAIHRQTVMLHLKRQNVHLRPQLKLDEPAMKRAIELYASGLSFLSVGEQLGVDASTIGKAFRRAGIACRPRPGASSR